MPKKLHLEIDGVKYVAKRADDTPEIDPAVLHQSGGAPPDTEETLAMETDRRPDETGDHPFPPLGRFEKHLTAPPDILGCERTPFLVLLGTVAFLVIAVFGIDVFGIIGGGLIFIGGVRWLRAMFEQDPQYFAMRWESMKYPRHLPYELPPEHEKGWAFVGYDDPPAPEIILKAWAGVTIAALVLSGIVYFFFGPLAGALTFALLMLVVTLWVFREELINRLWRGLH